ncbi:MAG TPA: NADH-quinone oxidoreductase subunit A [Chthoniobacterales bacterium]|jgi:NADH-quinone oxidoreductase subunit A|nr:NADH-quinone oxidoreductase subunit A [Chthoniobacterales bacterium]
MLQDYLPILLQVVVAIGFAAIGLVLSVIVGRVGKRNPIKDSPYECGMLPIGEAQPRFSVKFYLVAMLFILFDIEIVFMYPWAVVYRDYIAQFNFWTIFGSMLGFVTILMIGFVYAIKKGALDWKR